MFDDRYLKEDCSSAWGLELWLELWPVVPQLARAVASRPGCMPCHGWLGKRPQRVWPAFTLDALPCESFTADAAPSSPLRLREVCLPFLPRVVASHLPPSSTASKPQAPRTTKRAAISTTPGTARPARPRRRRQPPPPASVRSLTHDAISGTAPQKPTCSRPRRNTPAQSRFVSDREASHDVHIVPTASQPEHHVCSRLAHLRLIQPTLAPRALPSLVASALVAPSSTARHHTRDVIRHGIRDQVPRRFGRR